MRCILQWVVVLFAAFATFAQSQGGSGNSASSGGSSGGSGGNSGSGGLSGGNSGSGGPGTVHTTPTIALKIPNETAPPGGVAQMKFLTTEPTPISSGRPHLYFDDSMFDDVLGIEVFNSAGDINGIAVVDGPAISLSFVENGALQGTDYPVMTVALHVRPTAVPGSQTQFDLDSLSAFTVNSIPAIIKPVAPATVTVGGSISITNVVPGAGLLPAGTIVRVLGLGFQSRTQVQLTNVQAQSISVVSPTEIDITLAQATNMGGKKIQVVNPDGSQDTYFSYMRGVSMGASSWPMLWNAVPIFSSVSHSMAVFTGVAPALPSQFAGIAMQNPNLNPAEVTASLVSSDGVTLASATISIPPGYRCMREISELTGVSPRPGSSVVVTADQPVQVFGYIADRLTGGFTPFAAAVANP